MLFQVPLKFIITRLRERPIEYMLKVFELSNCVCDGALLLWVLGVAAQSARALTTYVVVHGTVSLGFYGHTWDYQS